MFKITHIEMNGVIGLAKGSHVKKLETAINKDLVLISGENGSGKSSILKCISFDPRGYSNTLHMGEEGGEIRITLSDGIKEYLLTHVYSFKKKQGIKASSILSENIDGRWQPLTTTSVKESREVIAKTFGISKQNERLLYLSDTMKNILDMSSIDRKKYFYDNIPDVERFTKRYETVSEKVKGIKRDLSSLNNRLSKINTDEENAMLETVQTEIRELTTEIENDVALMHDTKRDLEDTEETGYMTDEMYNETKKKLHDAKYALNILKELVAYPTLAVYRTEVQDALTDLKEQEREIVAKLDSVYAKKHSLVASINNDKNSIDVLSVDNTANIKKEIEELEIDIKQLVIDEKIPMYGNTYYYEDIMYIMNKIAIAKDNLERRVEDMLVLSEVVANYDVYKKAYTEYDELSRKIETLTRRSTQLSQAYDKAINVLDKRPKTCDDDNCGLIKSYLVDISKKQEIETIDEEITIMQKRCMQLNSDYKTFKTYTADMVEDYEYILRLMEEFRGLEDEELKRLYANKDNFINGLGIQGPDIISKLEYKLNNCRNIDKRDEMVNRLNRLKEMMDTTKVDNEIARLKLNIANNEDSIIDVNKELEAVKKDKDVISREVSDASKKLRVINEKYNNVPTMFDKKTFELEDIIKESSEKIEKYESKYASRLTLQEKLDDMNNVIRTKKDKLDVLRKEEMNITHKIKTANGIELDIAEATKDLETHSMIREALSPTKGLPLTIIQEYAMHLKDSVNHILDGITDYRIYDFKIDEKTFDIMILNTNGNINDTTDSLSGGERSIMSLAISIALNRMLNPTIGFILLDELDSTLSLEYRAIFYKIIENCGLQIFMISHSTTSTNIDMDKQEIYIDKNNSKVLYR